jgi:hypothetical protein
MAKFIGKGILQQYSQEIFLIHQIKVRDLPTLLKLPDELANILIVVRDHRKLDFDELILNGDDVYLYMAVMGG